MKIFLLSAAILFMPALIAPVFGQTASRGTSLSRSMEQAIRLYHEGSDNEAMDRFMDILVKGSPSEKALANDYISKITLRMNTGVNSLKDQGSDEGALKEVQVTKQSPAVWKQRSSSEEDLTPSEQETAEEEGPEAQKRRVSEKINEKITAMRRAALMDMQKSNIMKIYMGDSTPKAITLNPQYFFATDTVFKPEAVPALASLAGLLFTMGKANLLILPAGSVEGDIKIRSIRQAIALNSYLLNRGISPARLEVNLTGTDIKLPKELTVISGLVILCNYDRVMKLKDAEDAQSKGPKVSLGIYPTAISTTKNEGAVVEFSVFESPIGKPSWKFEIFSVQPDNSVISLQKIDGYGSQYNQSFWNGRKNFFGAPYPAGKYMFSVTAADAEGKETAIRRLLVIKPSPEELAQAASRKTALLPQSIELVKKKSFTTSKKKSPAKKPAKSQTPVKSKLKSSLKNQQSDNTAKTRRKPAAESQVQAEAGEEPSPENNPADTEFSGQMSYKVYFKEGTATITANSEKKLAQVSETLNYYPMSRVRLTGYASSEEAAPATVAQNRVNYVVAKLVNKYKLEKERMDISTQVVDGPKSVVEIKMLGKETE